MARAATLLIAIAAAIGCGRTEPFMGVWSAQELAIAVREPPPDIGGRDRVAIVRIDTMQIDWTPLEDVSHAAWVDEGRTIFATRRHGDEGATWRVGAASASAVPSLPASRLSDFRVSPGRGHIVVVDVPHTGSPFTLRVLDSRDLSELGRWTGCISETVFEWIVDGPAMLLGGRECGVSPGEGRWTLERIGDGDPRLLLDRPDPQWTIVSPDGRWLASARGDITTITDLSDGSLVFEQGPAALAAFVWSPDTSSFAYRIADEDDCIVRDMSMTEVGRFSCSNGQPQFSSFDGRIGASDRDAHVVHDPSTRETRRYEPPVPLSRTTWFRNDHRAYAESEFPSLGEPDDPTTAAYVLDPDTGSWTRLVRLTAWHVIPIWSPDGSMLAVHEGCDAQTQRLVVFDADLQRLFEGPCGDIWGPWWSPDSNMLAMQTEGGREVALVRLDGETRQVGPGRILGWRP
jgi:hypothetical protein